MLIRRRARAWARMFPPAGSMVVIAAEGVCGLLLGAWGLGRPAPPSSGAVWAVLGFLFLLLVLGGISSRLAEQEAAERNARIDRSLLEFERGAEKAKQFRDDVRAFREDLKREAAVFGYRKSGVVLHTMKRTDDNWSEVRAKF